MYDLYFWTTPNGYKPLLMLEEINASYELKSINIGKDEQFEPGFLKISPNNRIPALVDSAPSEGDGPLSVFESGAIMTYLAEKSGQFLPKSLAGRTQAMEWLMWQMGGLGPMAGQTHHFLLAAKEQVPYAIERYTKECQRLYGVMDRHLATQAFFASEYSIADMAAYPWVWRHERHRVNLDDFPHVKKWFETISERPATARASARGASINPGAETLLPG